MDNRSSSNLYYDFTLERKGILFFLLLSFVFHFMVAGLVYTVSIEKPPDNPPLFARVVTPEELRNLRSTVTSPPKTVTSPSIPVYKPYKETVKDNKALISQQKGDSLYSESGIDTDKKSSDTLRNPEELIKLPGAIIPKSSGQSETLAKLFDRELIKEQVKKEAEKEKPPEVTFDTKEFRYQGYMNRLKEKIESIWMYPASAAERGIYGDLYIRFSIKKDGSLGRVDLVRTSGYRELDDAAMKALYNAAPYWPLPPEWGLDEFIIEGHFIYTLYGYYIR